MRVCVCVCVYPPPSQVVRWSADPGPACLNRQLIAVLSGLGVPDAAFLSRALIAHSVLGGACGSGAAAAAACALLPPRPLARVRACVRTGAWDEPTCVDALRTACAAALVALATAAHIPVPRSRRLLIVPDPTGVLKVRSAHGRVFFRMCVLVVTASVGLSVCGWVYVSACVNECM